MLTTGGPTKTTTAYPWGAENSIWGTGFHDSVRRRMGHSAMWGIIAEDLPKVLGVTLMAAFFIVIANLVVDLLYAVVDPRVRTK